MKTKFLMSVMMAVSVVSSANAFATVKEFLTAEQQKAVLDSFDDQSSDNIDEGECVANYQLITCNNVSKSCTLFFRFDECAVADEITPKGYTFSCPIKKVASFKDVQDTGFEQVMDCIESM